MNLDNEDDKKIQLLDNILHGNNISQENIEELMKIYKKQLDNKKIIKPDEFENILNIITNNKDDINELKQKYNELINYDKNIKNETKYDSILFLSKINDKKFTKFKIGSCLKYKTLNFKKCIEHLKETERMLIVRSEDYENFFKNNIIYFDDEEHINNPKKDILYRKINNYYYVDNNDYFEKYTDFYFKLYSNIFSIFDLKQITLKYHNNSSKMKKINTTLNSGFANIGGSIEKYNENSKDNSINMNFNKVNQKNDNYNEFNKCVDKEQEINFLRKNMPQNLKKDMYNPSIILNLIKNRTKNTLSSFEQIQNIQNTNIEKVESSIQMKFNLNTQLGLFGSLSKSNNVNEMVVFKMDFHNIINNEDNVVNDEIDNLFNKLPPIEKDSKKKSNILKDEEIIEENEIKWIPKKRGDKIHDLSVFAGNTKTDGKVYIGKIDKSPGKVNIDKNKIWNYWIQNIGSSESGKMLVVNCKYEWQNIQRGKKIPENAVYCGKDESNDDVWVGKSYDNEAGKINCTYKDENTDEPIMHNFWCHGSFCSSQKAYILVVFNGKKTYLTEY
jgi:hypothetical protein